MSNRILAEAVEIRAEHVETGNQLFNGLRPSFFHDPAFAPHAVVAGRVFVLRTSVLTREQAFTALERAVVDFGIESRDLGYGVSIDVGSSLDQERSVPDESLVGLWRLQLSLPRAIEHRLREGRKHG